MLTNWCSGNLISSSTSKLLNSSPATSSSGACPNIMALKKCITILPFLHSKTLIRHHIVCCFVYFQSRRTAIYMASCFRLFLQRFVLKNCPNQDLTLGVGRGLCLQGTGGGYIWNIGKSSQALNVKPAAATFMAHSITAVITWFFCCLVSRWISFEWRPSNNIATILWCCRFILWNIETRLSAACADLHLGNVLMLLALSMAQYLYSTSFATLIFFT